MSSSISELCSAQSIEQIKETISQLAVERRVETALLCLQHVVATNYAGYGKYHAAQWISEEKARKELSRGMNILCVAVKSSWSLYIAKYIVFETLEEYYADVKKTTFRGLVAKLRVLLIWQHLLIERSNWIFESTLHFFPTLLEQLLEKSKSDAEAEINETVKIMLEMAAVHFQFYEYDKADDLISEAVTACRLDIDTTGMMGRRTRYQQKDVAQLVLVHKGNARINDLIEQEEDVPTNCILNDDTLLEKIAVSATSENETQVDGRRLSSAQLACLLWIARHEKSTHCADPLAHERCMPYVDTVLVARRCWPLQCAALLLRVELEKTNGRMVDRACSQTELVCKLMQGVDDESSDDVRLARCDYVLSSGLEPAWQANVLHTGILQSLGCTAESLLILEKLELWENVIDCYKALGQMEKAESLIRRLIEQKPDDSMLYSYLGDITNQAEYYHKAIELSNDRNARPHRSLGHSLLMQKKFEEAYKHLRRSLELQPIQLGTWFNAGYCAWKLEDYKSAIKCYHRCISFQPDHFEAWNNLSASYIRYGQKEKAWKLLQEALKYNYEHPNVWENYMLLSADIGFFTQAISAYHRLLDMNKRGADDELLSLLATQILKREDELTDNDEKTENAKEKAEMVKLLARITANHQTLSPKTLKLYAELKKPKTMESDTRTEFEKYIQLLEKSFALANGKQNWSKDILAACEVIETAVQLAQDRMRLAQFVNTTNSVREASARIRLSLRAVLSRLEKDATERVISEGNMEEEGEMLKVRLSQSVETAKEIVAGLG